MAASQKNVIVNEVENAMNSIMNDSKNADDLESGKITNII